MNEQEFWSSMKRDPNTGCLNWTRATFKAGYGAVNFDGKTTTAHRVAWALTRGEIPDGHDIHHNPTCRRTCCEISHLSLLTKADHSRLGIKLGQIDHSKMNHARGDRQGTHTHPESVSRGDTHYRAKITESQIKEIKSLRDQNVLLRVIAKMFGISETHVSRIHKGRGRAETKKEKTT